MKDMSSDDARRNLRQVLNEVEQGGEHVTIHRYGIPAAVIVPVDWYRSAGGKLTPDTKDGS